MPELDRGSRSTLLLPLSSPSLRDLRAPGAGGCRPMTTPPRGLPQPTSLPSGPSAQTHVNCQGGSEPAAPKGRRPYPSEPVSGHSTCCVPLTPCTEPLPTPFINGEGWAPLVLWSSRACWNSDARRTSCPQPWVLPGAALSSQMSTWRGRGWWGSERSPVGPGVCRAPPRAAAGGGTPPRWALRLPQALVSDLGTELLPLLSRAPSTKVRDA